MTNIPKMSAGFTTIELLIGSQLTLIIVAFIYAAYFFSLQFSQDWQDRTHTEGATILCIGAFNRDILQTQKIMTANSEKLSLLTTAYTQITYELKDSLLYRNQKHISGFNTRIDMIEFRYIRKDQNNSLQLQNREPQYFLPENELERAQIKRIEIALTAAGKKSRINVQSAVMPRDMSRHLINLQ